MGAASMMIRTSILNGLHAWLWYAAIEYVLAGWIPFLLSDSRVYSPWYWRAMLPLLAGFACTGLLAGILVAMLSLLLARVAGQSPEEPRIHLLASLTIIGAFTFNLIGRSQLGRSEQVALAAAAFAAVCCFLCIYSPLWRERLSFLTAAPAVSLLLLISPWINTEVLETSFWRDASWLRSSSGMVKGLWTLLAFAVVIGLSRLVAQRTYPLALRAAAPLLVLVASAGAGAVFNRGDLSPVPQAGGAPAISNATMPNVVVISMDTVRADHLSVYGYGRDTTPNLKALAGAATVYRRAYATSDMTLSTHASLFTGMYPRRHGAHYDPPRQPFGRPLGNLPTLAGILQGKGYSTWAVVANHAYLHPVTGLDQGFQIYDCRVPVPTANLERFFLRTLIRPLVEVFHPAPGLDRVVRTAEEVNSAAFSLLKPEAVRKPFLLFLNYMDAHDPYLPPAPYDTRFPGKDASLNHVKYRRLADAALAGNLKLTEAERAAAISQYDGGIAYLDDQLSKLIDHLERLNIYDNTLLIITADHGEAFGEKGLLSHAVSVDQNQIHIPLIVRYPNQSKAEQTDSLASQIDVLPTVLDVIGANPLAGIDGRSLRAAGRPAYYVSESYQNPTRINTSRWDRIERALISGDRKLIVSTRGRRELYDLGQDPQEGRSLYRSDGPDSAAMLANLDVWLKAVPAAAADTSAKPGNESLQRLKSLGYAQ